MRTVSPPAAVFLELGKQLPETLSEEISPTEFAEQRRFAEERCYRTLGTKTNIFDIYEELLDSLGLSSEFRDHLVTAEYELESRLLEVIVPNILRVATARAEGAQVVYVSDMYYPKEMLQKLLSDRGIFQDEDRIYVSTDHGVDKKSGLLFKEVMADLKISHNNFRFFGNHPIADFKSPRGLGIQAEHLHTGNPNRFEALLQTATLETNGLASEMAGASRASRIAINPPPSDEALVSVAAGVAAPLLTAYVLWILRESQRLQLERLYFLSRDGEVLLEIAKILAEKLNIDIELRYLMASRCSWARASTNGSLTHWYLADLTKATTTRDLFKRMGLKQSEVEESLQQSGFDITKFDTPISVEDHAFFRSFLESEAFEPARQTAQKRSRQILTQYFEQEGLFEKDGIGIIDIGWSGTLHDVAAEIVTEQKPHTEVYGYLFGAMQSNCSYPNHKLAFCFDERNKRGFPRPLKGKDCFVLMEIFCSASHGTVLDYHLNGDRIEAVIEETWGHEMKRFDLPLYRSVINDFVGRLNLRPDHINQCKRLRGALLRSMEEFWYRPTRAEALRWGRFPWNEGQGDDSGIRPIAESTTLVSLMKNSIDRKFSNSPAGSIRWSAGRIALSPKSVRSAYNMKKLPRYTRKLLRKAKKKLT